MAFLLLLRRLVLPPPLGLRLLQLQRLLLLQELHYANYTR